MKRTYLSLAGMLLMTFAGIGQSGNFEHLFPSMPEYVKQNEFGIKNLALNLSKANNSYDHPIQIEKYNVDLLLNETLDEVQNFTYSAGGELRSLIHLDGTMTNDERITFNWTSFGEISSMIHEQWNGWGWDFNYRSIYNYNSAQLLESMIYESYNGTDWEFDYGYQMLYLGGTSTPSLVIGSASDDNVNWQEEVKIYYTYSGSTPQSVEIVVYDNNYLQWVQEEKWEISNWGPGAFYPDFIMNERMGQRNITDNVIGKWNSMSFYPADFIYYSSYDYNAGVYTFQGSIESTYDGSNNRTEFLVSEYNGSTYDIASRYTMTYDPCYGYKSGLSEDYVSPGVWTINSGVRFDGTTVPYASSCYVTDYKYYSSFSDLEPNGIYERHWIITQATDLNTEDLDEDATLNLYPNPVEQVLNISVEGINGAASLEIVGLDGKSVRTIALTSSEEAINVEELPAGVYLARIVANGEATVERFVKR